MTDGDLLSEFAAGGSESAFAALVSRHVDMVYATARRQLGDPSLAEEVAQNVFIALARKSGGLRGSPTISGWLYKTTLLEVRHALRSELRRQRREAVAVELNSTNSTTSGQDSPWATLVPLLDEGLMKLREGDRLAVLLRFFEEKPFRDVGQALGISEDAAQKRVSKSLEELTRFFQRSGFRVSCAGASGAALFAEAATAAPACLAANATRIALSASSGAGLSGVSLVIFKVMNLTKLQFAIACICLTAVPVVYETQALLGARQDASALLAQLAARQQSLADAQMRRDAFARRMRAADNSLVTLPARAQALAKLSPPAAPRWVDSSPFARVPKELLERLQVTALGRDWRIRAQLANILALTPEQHEGTQRAVDEFFAEIRGLEEAHLEPLAQPPAENVMRGGQRVGFRVTRYEPEANAARVRLRGRLLALMGETRADLALRYLDFRPGLSESPTGGPAAPDEIFEGGSADSLHWNFHGYERTVAFLQRDDQPGQHALEIEVKFGPQNRMNFGAGEEVFNPAVASSLKAQWEAYKKAHPAPAPGIPK